MEEVANRPLSAWKIEVVNCGRVGFSLGGGSMRSDFDAQEAVRFVEGQRWVEVSCFPYLCYIFCTGRG